MVAFFKKHCSVFACAMVAICLLVCALVFVFAPQGKVFAQDSALGDDEPTLVDDWADITDMDGNYKLVGTITGEITAIGTYDAPFRGTFDGSGGRFENVVVKSKDGSASVGIFGACDGATIKNIRAFNLTILLPTNSTSTNLSADPSIDHGPSVEIVEVANTTTQIYAGGIVGCAKNTSITNCGVSNLIFKSKAEPQEDDGNTELEQPASLDAADSSDDYVLATTNQPAHIGGVAGFVSGVGVMDCQIDGEIDVEFSNKWSTIHYVGGVVGCLQSARVINVDCMVQICFAGGMPSDDNCLGGIVGKTANKSVSILNCLYRSDIECECENCFLGMILGSINTLEGLPNEQSIAFCYYINSNQHSQAIGQKTNLEDKTYNTSSLLAKDENFFSAGTNYSNGNVFYEYALFDMKNVWTIEISDDGKNKLTLQIMKTFVVYALSQPSYNITISNGNEVENGKSFLLGETIKFSVEITEDYKNMFEIKQIRIDGVVVECKRNGNDFEIVATAGTDGEISVDLSKKKYKIKIEIYEEYKDICDFKIGNGNIIERGSFEALYDYGFEFELSCVVYNDEYAFDGWYEPMGDNQPDSKYESDGEESSKFVVVVKKDTTLKLKLTREFFKLNISFDESLGNVLIYQMGEADENSLYVSGRYWNVSAIHAGQNIKLSQKKPLLFLFEPLENGLFVGCDFDENLALSQINSDVVDESSEKYANCHYLIVEEPEKIDKLSNLSVTFSKYVPPKEPINIWIIIGPCAGAVLIAVVIIIIVVKKKSGGSYKKRYRF